MIEQERKFILKYLPSGLKSEKIKQGYVSNNGKSQVRVRIIDDINSFITIKFKIDIQRRNEFEYKIPLSDAVEIYESCILKLEKTRYKTKFNSNKVDIDIYESGEGVVEIEFENELTSIPDYCGDEITGNKDWSNITFAKKSQSLN